MAGQKKPVKVKPSVFSAEALRLFSAKPVEGAQKLAEFSVNTTNRDLVKVQANFKRTNSQDTAELEFRYSDFLIFLEVLDELANTDKSQENVEPIMVEARSNFAGGQYSENPNPIGNLIVGRNGGVNWVSVQASGGPVVQFPFLETRFSRLKDREGNELPKGRRSELSTKAYLGMLQRHLAITIDDRYIPWQHRKMIEEGKPTPYSDKEVNYSYINTFNPGGGQGGGNSGGYQAPAPAMDFNDDIPF